MRKRTGWMILLATLVGLAGCGGPDGPRWTYYVEGPYAQKPDGHVPEIYYAVDQVAHLRGAPSDGVTTAPPHTAIASVAGCRLDRDAVVARARELGADAVIVTPVSEADDAPGAGAREPGREVAAATFIVFERSTRAAAADTTTH